jgi:hypothetical protein
MPVARSFKRQVSVKPLYSRPCYRMSGRSAACPSRSLSISAARGGALTATLVLGLGYSLYAEAPMPSEERVPTPLSKFLTSYAVYSMCSIPGLVDASPALLAFCTSVPGIRQLTEAFVRVTFFKQVVLAVFYVIGLILRNAVHSLLVATPRRNAYHRYAGSVPRTKAHCSRTAWKPMRMKLRTELAALRVLWAKPHISVSYKR